MAAALPGTCRLLLHPGMGAGRQNLPAGTSQPLPGWRIRLEPRILQAGQSSRAGRASLKLLEQAVPPLAAAVARMSGGCSRAGLEPPVFSDEILPPQTRRAPLCQKIKGIAPVPGLHTQRSGLCEPRAWIKGEGGAASPRPSPAQFGPVRPSSPGSPGSQRIQRFFSIPAPGIDSPAPGPGMILSEGSDPGCSLFPGSGMSRFGAF